MDLFFSPGALDPLSVSLSSYSIHTKKVHEMNMYTTRMQNFVLRFFSFVFFFLVFCFVAFKELCYRLMCTQELSVSLPILKTNSRFSCRTFVCCSSCMQHRNIFAIQMKWACTINSRRDSCSKLQEMLLYAYYNTVCTIVPVHVAEHTPTWINQKNMASISRGCVGRLYVCVCKRNIAES